MLKTTKFVDLLDAPYSRRGSFLALANDNYGEDLYGKCNLWLCSSRITGIADFNANNGFRILKFRPVHNGHPVPYVINTTPYTVEIETRYGKIGFVFADRKLVLAESSDGLSLRFHIPKPVSWFVDPVPPTPLEKTESAALDFRASKLFIKPITGELWQNNEYNEVRPDSSGKFTLALEDFYKSEPAARAAYPSFYEGVADVKADFDGYCARLYPSLPGEFEAGRLPALWQTWQMTVYPDGLSAYKRTMVKMIHSIFEGAFVWQQPLQAIVHYRDLPLAWDIYLSGFEHMDETGKMTDSLTYEETPSFGLKPPVHGTALLWLMENTDFASLPKAEKEWLYDKLIRWTEFWTKQRDSDGDGVMEFASLIETGWEDAPYFNVGFPCACPDLNALLALQMEAVAKLGADIGKPEAETKPWLDASRKLIAKISEKFWNGTEWFAYNAKTLEKAETHTVSLYFALLLGKRLPQDIINKSIEFMFAPNHFDSPYGLTTETLDSDYFFHGFTQGSVITPSCFWLAIALEWCGRRDLAAETSLKYARTQRDAGYFHIHNALTGQGDRSLTAFGEKGLFWSAWSSGAYLWLADRYGK
jgi:hypothetical protein